MAMTRRDCERYDAIMRTLSRLDEDRRANPPKSPFLHVGDFAQVAALHVAANVNQPPEMCFGPIVSALWDMLGVSGWREDVAPISVVNLPPETLLAVE